MDGAAEACKWFVGSRHSNQTEGLQVEESETVSSFNNTTTSAGNGFSVFKTGSHHDDVYLSSMATLSYLMSGPTTSALVVIGSVLNAVSIVLLRRSSNSAIALYLSALAVWNTILLISAFVLYAFPTVHYGKMPFFGDYVYLYRFAFTTSNMAFVGSVWILIALIVDRYIALMNPLYHHRQMGLRKTSTIRLILFVSCLAVLSGTPRYFELTIHTCEIFTSAPNQTAPVRQTVPLIALSAVGHNQYYLLIYRIIGGMFTHTLVPYAILFGLTGRVWFRVQKNRQRNLVKVPRESSGSTSAIVQLLPQQLRLTRHNRSRKHEFKSDNLLLALIFKFLTTNLSPMIIDIIEQIVGIEVFVKYAASNLLVDFSNLLVVINAATNFFIYIIWNQNFRVNFTRLLSDTWRSTMRRGSSSGARQHDARRAHSDSASAAFATSTRPMPSFDLTVLVERRPSPATPWQSVQCRQGVATEKNDTTVDFKQRSYSFDVTRDVLTLLTSDHPFTTIAGTEVTL